MCPFFAEIVPEIYSNNGKDEPIGQIYPIKWHSKEQGRQLCALDNIQRHKKTAFDGRADKTSTYRDSNRTCSLCFPLGPLNLNEADNNMLSESHMGSHAQY